MTTTIDWTTSPLHVIAEAVAPCAPPSGSDGAGFIATVRDTAIETIGDYTDRDRFSRDVLDGTLIPSCDVWQTWSDLRLWQDDACRLVLASADFDMVSAGTLDLTDIARIACQVVGHRIAAAVWEQHQRDD